MNKTMLSAVGIVALLGLGVSNQGRQEEDLKAQIASLNKDLKAHVSVFRGQEDKIKVLEDKVAAMESWFRTIPAAVQSLDAGIQDVEANGFTKAGENTRAREILLASLRTLGQHLKSSLPAPASK